MKLIIYRSQGFHSLQRCFIIHYLGIYPISNNAYEYLLCAYYVPCAVIVLFSVYGVSTIFVPSLQV
jgi:hypothetical protein